MSEGYLEVGANNNKRGIEGGVELVLDADEMRCDAADSMGTW